MSPFRHGAEAFTISSQYENPTPVGDSRNRKLASFDHEYGFAMTLPPAPMMTGPNSVKKPIREEAPGPPFSHRTSGSACGSRSLSTNM